jgi:hypothetical protein
MQKKVWIILGIFLLAQLLGVTSVSQAQYWAKAYDDANRWDEPKCVRKVPFTQGGGSIVVGLSQDMSGFYDVLAIRLNDNGNVQWKKRYDFFGSEFAEGVVVIPNGSGASLPAFLIVGHKDGDILTMMLNNLGNIVASFVYPLPGFDERALCIEPSNTTGPYIVVGVSNWPYGTFTYNIMALLVAPPGLPLSPMTVYDFWGPAYNEDGPVSVCVRNNPLGYVVSAGTQPGLIGGIRDGIVMELNAGLGVVWAREYLAPLGQYIYFWDIDANLVGFTPTSDIYDYLVTGEALSPIPPRDMLVMRLPNNGTPVTWTRLYDGGAHDYGRSIDVWGGIPGEYVVTGGTNSWFAGDYNGFGTRADYVNPQIWTTVLKPTSPPFNPMNGEDWGCSIEAFFPGPNYMVAGRTKSVGTGGFYDYDFLVARVDPNGIIVPPDSCLKKMEFRVWDEFVPDAIPFFEVYSFGIEPRPLEWVCDTVWMDTVINERRIPCGDVNGDGKINLADVIYLANYVLKSGPAPVSEWASDVNCDYKINLSDVIVLARYVLLGGALNCCP